MQAKQVLQLAMKPPVERLLPTLTYDPAVQEPESMQHLWEKLLNQRTHVPYSQMQVHGPIP